MSPLTNVSERSIELNGKLVFFLARPQNSGVADTVSLEFSFDGGETWSFDRSLAYNKAQAAGKLRFQPRYSNGEDRNDPAFESWILEFVGLMQGLDVGESLKVTRTQTSFVVTKENIVSVCRGSTVSDVALKPDQSGDPTLEIRGG